MSISKISEVTGMCRETVRKRLTGLAYISDGLSEMSAKGYESTIALPTLYQVDVDGQPRQTVTAQQAQVNLAIARKDEIDLGMEVTRKERIPLETLAVINEEAFSNIAGLIKSHEGKVLTPEVINDLFTEARSIGSKIKERAA